MKRLSSLRVVGLNGYLNTCEQVFAFAEDQLKLVEADWRPSEQSDRAELAVTTLGRVVGGTKWVGERKRWQKVRRSCASAAAPQFESLFFDWDQQIRKADWIQEKNN